MIVTKVITPRVSVDQELFLVHPVLDPIEAHVHGLKFVLMDGAVGDASGTSIVSLDGSWRLGMAHLNEGGAERDAIARIVVEANKFRFGSVGHEVVQYVADIVNGAVVRGGVVGGLAGLEGLLLRKKWPPTQLQAWGSEG